MPSAQVPSAKSHSGAVAARWAVTKPRGTAYEALVAVAAQLCAAPLAVVTTIDETGAAINATAGFPEGVPARIPGFICHTIARRETIEIVDAQRDERFRTEPVVRGPLGVRAYLGVPLLNNAGLPIGVLSVMDRVPRSFEPSQRGLLAQLASVASCTIEALAATPKQITDKLDLLSTVIETANDAVLMIESTVDAPQIGRITYVNDVALSLFGYEREDLAGKSPSIFYGRDTDRRTVREIASHMRGAQPLRSELTCYRADGSKLLIDFTMTPLRSTIESDRSAVVVLRDVTEARRTQEELRTLWAAVKEADDGVCVYRYSNTEKSWRVVYVNDAMTRMTDFTREELLHDVDLILLSGDRTNRSEMHHFFSEIRAGRSVRAELQLYKRGGDTVWIEFVARPMAASGPPGCIAVARDVTERKQSEERIRLLTSALEQSGDMVTILQLPDRSNELSRIVYVNAAFEHTTGYDRNELLGKTLAPLIHRDENLQRLIEIRNKIDMAERTRVEVRFVRKDGSELWVEAAPQPIVGGKDGMRHLVVGYRDVTMRKKVHEVLSYEAAHDPLTGLYNRRYFDRALEQALKDMRRTSMPHCLALMDLDEFKPVNDVYGHDAGDAMLKAVAQSLSRQIRSGDLLARIGGDEFAVIFHECNLESAARIAEVLLRQVQSCSVDWNGHQLRVGASVGLVPINASFGSVAHLLKAADERCYDAKRAGRNRVSDFSLA